MDTGSSPPIHAMRTRVVIYALVGATAICLLLLGIRSVFFWDMSWLGFARNLLLAWIPLIFACALCGELDRPARRRWLLGGFFAGWMLFFPNAAYMVTDLATVHTGPPVPRWFDYILVAAYAWTGVSLCYVSLRLLHARIQSRWGERSGWLFVGGMLAAGSFGIYAGRFFRWNSWDVVMRPWKPLQDLARLGEPATQLQALAFCVTFFLFSVLVYGVFHALAHLHTPVVEKARAAKDGSA